MPVTFSVAPHSANSVNVSWAAEGFTAREILARACPEQNEKAKEILQFAFSTEAEAGSRRDLTTKIKNLLPNNNGFVCTVIEAYNGHHALVIRPDDVWLAILSQFNFFVNANAELLRANFVTHSGKVGLRIVNEGTRHDLLDFGSMARQMVDLIEKNIVDPTLRAWAIPSFTTTTENDTTVAAVLLLATLKEYFSYGFCGIACGIPRVTLEGEKSDWVNILGRLEKLKEYGIQTIAWYHLLRPVIARFVAAFESDAAASGKNNVDFWQKVAHYHSMGSGMNYYYGWINAFNVFTEKGVWMGHTLDLTAVTQHAPENLSAQQFWATYAPSSIPKVRELSVMERLWKMYRDIVGDSNFSISEDELVLDGTPYHRVRSSHVPPGFAEVDVKLDDNGEMLNCVMIAGTVGTHVSSSGDRGLSLIGEDDVCWILASVMAVFKGDFDLLVDLDSFKDVLEVEFNSWWYTNRAVFPNLYKIARDTHCIPGSAVAVERVFSGGRDTIALRRSRLPATTIRTLMVFKAQLRLARKQVLGEADAIGLST
ncbi:hypothetical protein B0H19DRAFT_1385307 [Mycena capillaripes]|nr:hypothetical protein B0H19DRAFT_1385307 [Mycena capillaripes]